MGQPGEGDVLAVHVLAKPAGPTDPAGPDGTADGGLSLLDRLDAVADLDDRAGVLVAQRERRLLGHVVGPHPSMTWLSV